MKFGICSEIFYQGLETPWKIEDAMGFAAECGYHGFEIAPFTLGRYVTEIGVDARKQVREAAKQAGIAISGIHWVLVQTENLHVTHPEAAIRERTSQYFCDLVDFCHDLGGESIIVGSPKQRNILGDVDPEQGWAWATEVFRKPVKRAADCGVTICFEPLAPSETNFVNTAAEAIRFVKQLESPAFKIILDVKAMCSEEKTIPQIIRESWPEFGYFHANDENLKGPGFGDVDFEPIAAALREVGYDGYVSVEVFKFEEGPEAIARRSLEYLRKVFESGN